MVVSLGERRKHSLSMRLAPAWRAIEDGGSCVERVDIGRLAVALAAELDLLVRSEAPGSKWEAVPRSHRLEMRATRAVAPLALDSEARFAEVEDVILPDQRAAMTSETFSRLLDGIDRPQRVSIPLRARRHEPGVVGRRERESELADRPALFGGYRSEASDAGAEDRPTGTERSPDSRTTPSGAAR